MDSEGACLVTGRAHHAAVVGSATTHDDRLAAELRMVALLDGGEERVEVDVEDRALGHAAIIAPPPDQPSATPGEVTPADGQASYRDACRCLRPNVGRRRAHRAAARAVRGVRPADVRHRTESA